MSEVAKAVKPLFDKFIDFFDIFDLSFFVSGATFVAAIAWVHLNPDLDSLLGSAPGRATQLPGLAVVVLVFASYICGMTCFAVGRFVRKRVTGWMPKLLAAPELHEELRKHGLISKGAGGAWELTEHGRRIPWLPRYFLDGGHEQDGALYVRLWAEIREREGLNASFSLVRRYWVSAATLDGLFIALLTWSLLLALVVDEPLDAVPPVLSFVGALFCLREALRYDHYQREEIIATVLHAYDRELEPEPEPEPGGVRGEPGKAGEGQVQGPDDAPGEADPAAES